MEEEQLNSCCWNSSCRYSGCWNGHTNGTTTDCNRLHIRRTCCHTNGTTTHCNRPHIRRTGCHINGTTIDCNRPHITRTCCHINGTNTYCNRPHTRRNCCHINGTTIDCNRPHIRRTCRHINGTITDCNRPHITRTCCRRHREHADVAVCRALLAGATASCLAVTKHRDVNSCRPADHHAIHQPSFITSQWRDEWKSVWWSIPL